MAWVLLALQVVLSVVLLIAAAEKALRSEEFVTALRLSHVPDSLVPVVAITVPVVEVVLALALLLVADGALPVVLILTLILLTVFTAWMAWVRARRLRVHCGCFGTGSAEVGPRTIVRNLVLLAVAIVALVVAAGTDTVLPGPSFPMLVIVTSVTMGIALLLALRTVTSELTLSLDQYHAGGAQGGD